MQETVAVSVPDGSALSGSAQRALDSANSMVIDSHEMYQIAGEDLANIKRRQKELEEQRTGIVKPLNEAVKRINDMFRAPMEFLTQAEGILKRRMLTYTEEQERKRRAEEAKLRAEAERRAAEERTRLEAQRRADEERARIEQEKLERERQVALEAGDTVKAAKIEARVEGVQEALEIKSDAVAQQFSLVGSAPVVPITAAAPTIKGISSRGVWKAEVTDKLALVKFVAANPQYINLLEPATKELGAIAKALKANAVIDGVRIYEDKILSSRSA
jgi:colicin import membrane protein